MEGKKTINSHANTPQKAEVGDDGRQGRPTHRGGGGGDASLWCGDDV